MAAFSIPTSLSVPRLPCVDGSVKMKSNTFLDKDQIDKGYVIACSTEVLSNLRVRISEEGLQGEKPIFDEEHVKSFGIQEEGKNQSNTFNALFDDAAERLACTEIKKIESRIDKAAGDREKFNKWIRDFYKSHAVYVTKVLAPLSEALQEETGEGLPLEAIVQKLTTEGIDAFTKGDPIDSLAAWKESRKENIVIMLEEATNGQR